MNKEFSGTLLYEAWNNEIQAIAVKLPADIPCKNPHPHVTVSWENGQCPRYSNLMLATKYNYQLLGKEVEFRIEFFEFPS